MQAGGGFVEDVECSAGVAFGEFQGEFDALGFAAGEGGGGLAEADVAERRFMNVVLPDPFFPIKILTSSSNFIST